MFNVFKKILNKSEITEEDINKISDFVFCRWLSGNANLIGLSNLFNQYPNIPIELKVKIVQNLVGGKVRYIPYPKGTKETEVKDLEYISEFFNISREKAQLYAEFIDKKELQQIKDDINSKKGGIIR
jgi:hypothetical protein